MIFDGLAGGCHGFQSFIGNAFQTLDLAFNGRSQTCGFIGYTYDSFGQTFCMIIKFRADDFQALGDFVDGAVQSVIAAGQVFFDALRAFACFVSGLQNFIRTLTQCRFHFRCTIQNRCRRFIPRISTFFGFLIDLGSALLQFFCQCQQFCCAFGQAIGEAVNMELGLLGNTNEIADFRTQTLTGTCDRTNDCT